MKGIKIDFSNVFKPNVNSGVTEEEVKNYEQKISGILKEISENKPGFLDLPFNRKWIDSVLDIKNWVQSFENVVVLGKNI